MKRKTEGSYRKTCGNSEAISGGRAFPPGNGAVSAGF